jgi:two-component system response regulator
MEQTILIVDDNPDDIEIARRILAKSNSDVRLEEVRRGEDALELLRNGKELPSLILLDLKMPGMNGIDTLRVIRADERLRDIPVVILTSSSLDSDRKESFDAGADAFFNKAFDISQFSEDIKCILDRWLRD